MSIRLEKPWLPLDRDHIDRLLGQLGVYQIVDADDRIVYMGFAGGRSLFGLRSELQAELEKRGPGFRFRYEVNMQYQTRWRELLMVYVADHGAPQPENADVQIGRLSPA